MEIQDDLKELSRTVFLTGVCRIISCGIGFGIIGLLLLVLFLGALIVGGIWLVKTVLASSQPNQSGNITSKQASARDILDQRYARGEISWEEYEQIKADLCD